MCVREAGSKPNCGPICALGRGICLLGLGPNGAISWIRCCRCIISKLALSKVCKKTRGGYSYSLFSVFLDMGTNDCCLIWSIFCKLFIYFIWRKIDHNFIFENIFIRIFFLKKLR